METGTKFRAHQSKTSSPFNQKQKKVNEKEKKQKGSKYKELGRDELVRLDLTGPTSLSNVHHANGVVLDQPPPPPPPFL